MQLYWGQVGYTSANVNKRCLIRVFEFHVLLYFQLNSRGRCKISHFGGRLKFCRRYGRQMLSRALNTHICLATES